MRLVKKVLITISLLIIVLDAFLITESRKLKRKFGSSVRLMTQRSKKKQMEACNMKCTDLCSKITEKGLPCNRGSCFPNNMSLCYCWHATNSGSRVNCKNIRNN